MCCNDAYLVTPRVSALVGCDKWQPPRSDTCVIFDHNDDQCPKKVKVVVPNQVSDDGFAEVTRMHRKGKQNSKPRHIDGVRLTKPKPNYYYRPVSKPVNVNGEASTSQPKENKEPSALKPKNKGKDVSDLQEINVVSLQNSDSEEVENLFVKDNGKHMDDLVDDARKKVEAPPKKTSIWSGRKADSPKRNVVFSPETKVHYFDRDDMIFDDMG
ncbi:hypothetical protein Tco_1022258 [Tanacetum coccineum]